MCEWILRLWVGWILGLWFWDPFAEPVVLVRTEVEPTERQGPVSIDYFLEIKMDQV